MTEQYNEILEQIDGALDVLALGVLVSKLLDTYGSAEQIPHAVVSAIFQRRNALGGSLTDITYTSMVVPGRGTLYMDGNMEIEPAWHQLLVACRGGGTVRTDEF